MTTTDTRPAIVHRLLEVQNGEWVGKGDYVEYEHPKGGIRHGKVLDTLPEPYYKGNWLFVQWVRVTDDDPAFQPSRVKASACTKWDPKPYHEFNVSKSW